MLGAVNLLQNAHLPAPVYYPMHGQEPHVHQQVENGLVESNHTEHSSADRGGCVFSWIARRGLDSKSSLRSLQSSVAVSDGELSKRVPGHAA